MNRQTIYVLLMVLTLLQSCVVYQKTSISINEALDNGRVKVISTRGDDLMFKNIELKEGIYYGVNPDKEIRLDTAQISAIYLKDINKSTRNTTIAWISLSIGIPAAIIIITIIDIDNNGMGLGRVL